MTLYNKCSCYTYTGVPILMRQNLGVNFFLLSEPER